MGATPAAFLGAPRHHGQAATGVIGGWQGPHDCLQQGGRPVLWSLHPGWGRVSEDRSVSGFVLRLNTCSFPGLSFHGGRSYRMSLRSSGQEEDYRCFEGASHLALKIQK